MLVSLSGMAWSEIGGPGLDLEFFFRKELCKLPLLEGVQLNLLPSQRVVVLGVMVLWILEVLVLLPLFRGDTSAVIIEAIDNPVTIVDIPD